MEARKERNTLTDRGKKRDKTEDTGTMMTCGEVFFIIRKGIDMKKVVWKKMGRNVKYKGERRDMM